jgi:hypothetical protein
VKQPPPPTQWRQRAPYAFVSRVSLSAQVFEALLGSHTGSPGARGAAAAGALEGARAQNTEGRSQRVTTPAHIPSTPTSSSPPDPSAQFPVALFGHFPRRAAAKAGRAGVPPSQLRRKRSPTRQALPSQQPSGRKVGQQPGTSTHARSPRPPRQAIAQCLVANAQLSATGSSTNLLHFACAGPRARGMHCFTQAMAYQ